MKRKALLLIIPFAAAGLAGCQQNNPNPPAPQCDSATVSITSAGGVTAIKPGEQLQLTAQVNLDNCSFSWDSTNKSVATVDSNGLVTAISVGETTIKYGSGEFVLTVDNDPPAPQKEVVEVLSVKSHPESVVVGGSISPSSVILNVKFNDGSTGEKAATDVECNTSTAGNAVEAKAYYNDLGPATFEIKVIAQGETTHAGTEVDPFDSADAASVASALAEGGVTPKSYYIKGVVEKLEENFNSQYGNYSFNIGNNFLCWRLLNGPDKAKFNEGDIEVGDEVVVYATIQKFHQDAQGDKPARNLLETKEGYVVSVKKGSAEKEVEALLSATGPSQVVVDTVISPADVTISVRFTDQSTGTVKATRVVCNTSVAGDAIQGQAYYNDLGPVSFTVKVVAQSETTHAGTEADPYDSADAASVASALAEGGVTQQSYYIKGTVEKFEETFSSQYGNYSFNIGNNFICWRLKNGSSKANFNEGDIEIGDEVVVYAQIQKFHQDAQGDKPARNLLETKDGYVVSVNKGGEQKEVTGITAVSYTKTLYVGGTINPSDVTLTVSYSDDTSGSVKAQSVDGYSTEEAGKTTATAHYGTFTKDFDVEVKVKPAPTGESSVYTFTNDKTVSQNMGTWTSEQFLEHVVVDGDEVITGIKDVTNAYIGGNGGSGDATWEILNCFKVGKSNAGGTATLTLDSSIVFESIKVSAIGNRDDGTLTINGVTKNVTKKAAKGSLEPMELEFEVEGGISELKISSKEASSNNYGICITQIEFVGGGTPTPQKEITGVELQGTLEKSSYIEGQTFDPSGLSLKVTYNEGDPDVLTSGFTFNVTNPLEVGEYDLKATYQGHTTEGFVHISVVAKAITALEIKSGMTKTAYVLEEAWAPAGIVVEATYNDGTKANLQSGDYTLEFDPTEPALDTEEVSIVAKVANGTTSAAYTQTVSVTEEKVEATLIGIVASGYTKTATVGQTYTFDGTVTASYSDGSSHAVTGYTWTTSISTASAGQKTGVISYTEGDETKTCNVVVTVSAPATEKTFDLVKKQDDLTSGKYLITHGTTGSVHVFNSSLETLDAVNNYVSATVSNGSIAMTTDLEAVMVEYNADDGSLKLPSGKYLDGSTAKSLKTNSSAVEHTITIGNDGATTINCGSNALKFNDASDQMRFRYYASGQKALNLFKLTEGEPAPAKDIESLGDVSAPESINKGAKLDTKDVEVAIVYTDKTEGSVHPDSIDLDTSTVSDSVTGTVHVGDLTATFTIKVVDAPVTQTYTLTIDIKALGTPTSYSDNNDVTIQAVSSTGSKFDVVINFTQIMNNSGMQFKASKGFLYNKTDLGKISSVTINDNNDKLKAFFGTTALSSRMTSGTTEAGNYGFFNVSDTTSNAGKASSIVIVFEK